MDAQQERIAQGLAAIRTRRRAYLAILFSFFPVLVAVMAAIRRTNLWWLILLPIGQFIVGMVVQHRLHRSRCPRCQDFFFVQVVTPQAYTPASSISFPPQRRCQHCGQVLNR